jgi:hypothetical protein
MPITDTVTVAGPIAPTSISDTYPVTDPKYGLGGLRTVANQTERDGISTERRQVGMFVYQNSNNAYYTLVGGTDNANWRQVVILIPDLEGNIHIDANVIISGYLETDTGIRGGTDEPLEYLGRGMLMDCGEY